MVTQTDFAKIAIEDGEMFWFLARLAIVAWMAVATPCVVAGVGYGLYRLLRLGVVA